LIYFNLGSKIKSYTKLSLRVHQTSKYEFYKLMLKLECLFIDTPDFPTFSPTIGQMAYSQNHLANILPASSIKSQLEYSCSTSLLTSQSFRFLIRMISRWMLISRY